MKRKPREPVDRPTAIKLIIGGVAILLVGGFIGRTLWNEHRLTSDIPMSPLILEEDEISTEPVSDEEVANHCAETADNALCRLGMPTIDASNTKVVTLGTVVKKGNRHIAAPRGLYEAGWYDGSVLPGENGITFINGHSSLNNPATFNRLKDLQVGDKITLERGDGTIFTYKIAEVSRISLDDANGWVKNNLGSADTRRRNSGGNVLYLMTCVGSWNLNESTMNERILVRAEPLL
jgi:LPXTG-site transpeptidase (sortase) family protein